MKRYSWIAALLVVALAFVLFGCGGEDPAAPAIPPFETNVLQLTCIETGWGPGIDFLDSFFKFKDDFTIEVEGVALTTTQIMFNNNDEDYAPAHGEDEKPWDPKLAAGEVFEAKIILTEEDATFASPKYGAPEGLRLRFANGGAQKVVFTKVIVKNRLGKELFNLVETLEDVKPGPLPASEIDKVDGLKAAGNATQILFEVLPPAKK